jgi:hypothetical protein
MFDKEHYDNEFYVKQEADKLISMMQGKGNLVPMMKKYIIDYCNPIEYFSDDSDDDTDTDPEVDIIHAQMMKILNKVHISFLLLVMVKICINNNLFCSLDRKELTSHLQDSKFWSMPKNNNVVMMILEKEGQE